MLAIIAHIRHTETDYDDLLLEGMDRHEARAEVQELVAQVLQSWGAD